MQDTLERARSNWRLWQAGTDLRAWLFTQMHNLYANQVHRSTRQAEAGICANADDVAHELVAPDSGTAQSLDLQRCLLRLPQDQRIVRLLVSLEDLSYEERRPRAVHVPESGGFTRALYLGALNGDPVSGQQHPGPTQDKPRSATAQKVR